MLSCQAQELLLSMHRLFGRAKYGQFSCAAMLQGHDSQADAVVELSSGEPQLIIDLTLVCRIGFRYLHFTPFLTAGGSASLSGS